MGTKVVINKCYGGFGLSLNALAKIYERKGHKLYVYQHEFHGTATDERETYSKVTDQAIFSKDVIGLSLFIADLGDNPNRDAIAAAMEDRLYITEWDLERTDPDLVAVVEELGIDASSECAELEIVELPDDVKGWYIDEYDGMETIRETHRSW